MSTTLMTVEQAAQRLNLHPKTVLRYIREGRLPATRVGKSYRIVRGELDAFAGVAGGGAEAASGARATCIIEVPDLTPEEAQRLAGFLASAALARDAGGPALHLETAFDPLARSMKVVAIGSPAEAGRLLEMLELQLRGRG
ncbi:MAG TPA: helix-turn-helix domain-containing protein [Devosiaceae bacterium]|jgi:excisionase family DNA binding protein|nr:helix-turn-helix domain-containing protein [Devosiaceae bacterium]